jgi:hypothetical protein
MHHYAPSSNESGSEDRAATVPSARYARRSKNGTKPQGMTSAVDAARKLLYFLLN